MKGEKLNSVKDMRCEVCSRTFFTYPLILGHARSLNVHSLAGPLVELQLPVLAVLARVFAGAPAGYRVLDEQTLPPL